MATIARTRKGIRDQLLEVVPGERLQADLPHLHPSFTDCIELAHQRMRSVDLVIAIRTEQEQMFQLRPGQQILDQTSVFLFTSYSLDESHAFKPRHLRRYNTIIQSNK